MLRDFPTIDVVLAHGGRGWWYDAAAFLALSHAHAWIELSGLPPSACPSTTPATTCAGWPRKFVFGTDWPGVPGTAQNARAVAGLGLDEETAALVLGGNALRVYAGLEHLAPGR